jgi:hypothetical protein
MPASFREVFGNAGVDEDAKPIPGMIVPRGSSNIVRLVGGRDLRVDSPPTLKVVEIIPPSISTVVGAVVTALLTPTKLLGRPIDLTDSRIFAVSGHSAHGRITAKVKAINPRTAAVEAQLEVAVLGQRRVKLSIRPIQIRDAQGFLSFHSKKPFDPKALVDRMNSIWTPQANVIFKLVSSNPVLIDEGVEIAKLLKSKNQKEQLPSMVVVERFEGLFNRFKDPNADLTMFLVEKVGRLDRPQSLNVTAKEGVTNPALGISFISDSRTSDPDLLAHEAGHFLGSFVGQGGRFVVFGHKGGTTDLMQLGGSVVGKIPFHDVADFNSTP